MEYIILWILALFGLWSLISNIAESISAATGEGSFDVILNVCNREDSIEALIRQLCKIDEVRKIRVFDNNSTDDTLGIVKEMQKSNSKIILEEGTYEEVRIQ